MAVRRGWAEGAHESLRGMVLAEAQGVRKFGRELTGQQGRGRTMSERHAFDGILASLHEAMLDDSRWLSTSGLFDDACRTKGNMLTFAEGQTHQDVEIFYVRFCFRGERNRDLEREYFENYYPWDERVPRLRKLPDGQIVHTSDLYTEQERKTSPAFNEVVPVGGTQNGLSVRLDGPGGSRIVWTICDPVDGDDWSSDQLDMIRRLLPHIRQFVRVRQAVADAGGRRARPSPGLLDNTRFGISPTGPPRADRGRQRPGP